MSSYICDDVESRMISSALIFNLGLSYHLRALCYGRERRQRQPDHRTTRDIDLSRAQKAYDLAALSLQSLCLSHLKSDDEGRIVMAIYNNKAHTNYHFFDVVSAQHSLRTLNQLLSQREAMNQTYNDEQWKLVDQHFYVNAGHVTNLATFSPAA